MIPEDVLSLLQAMAADKSIGYQTLINQILRDATNGAPDAQLQGLREQLNRIEKISKKPAFPFDDLSKMMAHAVAAAMKETPFRAVPGEPKSLHRLSPTQGSGSHRGNRR